MEQAIAQRLSTLTQIIVVVGVIALVGALRRYDTFELRDNVIALGALADPANGLDPSHAPEDPKTLTALGDWIARNRPDVAKKRLETRTRFVAWLKAALKPQQFDPARFVTKGTGGSGALSLDEIALPSPPNATPSPEKPSPPGTVGNLLDRFEVSAQPLDVRIVTDWDPSAKTTVVEDTHGAIVTAISAGRDADAKDRIAIKLAGSTNPADQTATFTVYVNATAEALGAKSPALRDLAAVHADALAVLENASQRDRLRQSYGAIPIANALSIVQDELSAAYGSIAILGFSISPTHLPVAVLLIQVVVATLVSKSVSRARRSLEEKEVESALYPLVKDRVWRAVLWIVVPVLSVWATAVFGGEQLTSRLWPLVLLAPGSVALVALGVRSWVHVNHLLAPMTAAPTIAAPAGAAPARATSAAATIEEPPRTLEAPER